MILADKMSHLRGIVKRISVVNNEYTFIIFVKFPEGEGRSCGVVIKKCNTHIWFGYLKIRGD